MSSRSEPERLYIRVYNQLHPTVYIQLYPTVYIQNELPPRPLLGTHVRLRHRRGPRAGASKGKTPPPAAREHGVTAGRRRRCRCSERQRRASRGPGTRNGPASFSTITSSRASEPFTCTPSIGSTVSLSVPATAAGLTPSRPRRPHRPQRGRRDGPRRRQGDIRHQGDVQQVRLLPPSRPGGPAVHVLDRRRRLPPAPPQAPRRPHVRDVAQVRDGTGRRPGPVGRGQDGAGDEVPRRRRRLQVLALHGHRCHWRADVWRVVSHAGAGRGKSAHKARSKC